MASKRGLFTCCADFVGVFSCLCLVRVFAIFDPYLCPVYKLLTISRFAIRGLLPCKRPRIAAQKATCRKVVCRLLWLNRDCLFAYTMLQVRKKMIKISFPLGLFYFYFLSLHKITCVKNH